MFQYPRRERNSPGKTLCRDEHKRAYHPAPKMASMTEDKKMPEWHGIQMMRVLKALKYCQAHKIIATAPQIAQLIGKTRHQVQGILDYIYIDYNLVRRRILGIRKRKKAGKGCFWEYEITAKGENRFWHLVERFGDIVELKIPEQPAKCCVTKESKPQGPAQVLSYDPLTRMQEIDRLLKGKK